MRLALPLALALALAAGPAPASRAAAARPPRRDRTEFRITFRAWETVGAFRMEASSGRTDQGAVRDQGGFSATGGAVRRVLEGEKGTLVLRLQARTRAGTPPVFGRWTVASGTGAYAGVTGGGTFTAMGSAGRRSGSPYELQFLVGQLVHDG